MKRDSVHWIIVGYLCPQLKSLPGTSNSGYYVHWEFQCNRLAAAQAEVNDAAHERITAQARG